MGTVQQCFPCQLGGAGKPQDQPRNSVDSIKVGLSPLPQPQAPSHPIICFPKEICAFLLVLWITMETSRNRVMPGRLSHCCSESTLVSPLQVCSPAGDPSWEKQAEGSPWGLSTFPPPMWEGNNSSLYTMP